jgi:DNA-binding MarR family transcriptional regulator/GNAT superfamily N-acetyltransferase
MAAASRSDISAVRRFNRFYTREVGALRKNFLDTPWSLAEMRVLFEIANGKDVTASDLGKVLDLDAAYLSRLLQKFEKDGLISRTRSEADGRVSYLALSPKGRKQFSAANERQVAQTTAMLAPLKPVERQRLVGAMSTIEQLLNGQTPAEGAQRAYTLREPKPGDFGWIVARHAELYGEEYNWSGKFEGLCAQIVADFVNKFDPRLEKCWIAEVDGQRAGCIMLVKDDPGAKKADVARIRLLLLEPSARGMGLGRRLVEECVAFSRAKGYRRVTLWTHKELTAARAIYAKLGFEKTGEESHDDWGGKATSEFWDMDL